MLYSIVVDNGLTRIGNTFFSFTIALSFSLLLSPTFFLFLSCQHLPTTIFSRFFIHLRIFFSFILLPILFIVCNKSNWAFMETTLFRFFFQIHCRTLRLSLWNCISHTQIQCNCFFGCMHPVNCSNSIKVDIYNRKAKWKKEKRKKQAKERINKPN